MVQARLKFWGWGYEGDVLSPDEVRWLESAWAKQFRIPQFDLTTSKQSTRRALTGAGLPGNGASAFCGCPGSAKH